MTKVYSCSPFLMEFDLLDLKISEERDLDGILIIEANQTFQGNPKKLLLKNNKKYQNVPNLNLLFVQDELTMYDRNGKFSNSAHQKNAFDRFFTNIQDEDVFIFSDLDEINNRRDLPRIIDEAKKHDLVRLKQQVFCYKINIRRSPRKGWNASFAITGKKLKSMNRNIQFIRQNRKLGKSIPTDGKHFSFLMTPEEISYKIQNFSHSEYNQPVFYDVDKIRARIDNLEDLFMRRNNNGKPYHLEKVEVDETYPETILDNLQYWSKHIV